MKGSLVAGRYEILNPLGRGGMGMVYKAHDRVLDETVALKVLRSDLAQEPDMARRFRSEIKLARKVTHTNVCRIHDYGEDGPLGYIAMELVDGMDLKQLRAQRGQLATPEAFEAAIQIVEGLQAIHDAGVMHRDLKTSNVMLDANGRIRLMDFGIAKQVGATVGATAMGHIVGTPEYMSPEQARGLKLDFRSDIYSMGIVIYEMFSGHVPFRGDTPIATIFLSLEQPPVLEGPEAVGIPAALVPVLAKALAKDPTARYGSAHELSEALKAARSQAFPGVKPAAVRLTPVAPVPPSEGVTSSLRTSGSTPLRPAVAAAPTPQPMTPPPPAPTPQPAPTPKLAATVTTPTPTAKWQGGAPQAPPAPARQARAPMPPERAAAQRPQQQAPSRVGLWLTLGSLLAIAAFGSLALLVKELINARTTQAPIRTEASPAGVEPMATPSPEASAAASSRPLPPLEIRASEPSAVPSLATASPPSRALGARPIPADPYATTPRATPSAPVERAASPAPVPPQRRTEIRATASESPGVATSAASQSTGRLHLVVKPWAEVFVDDNPVGTTPLQPISLSVGSHTVRLSHPDFRPLQRKVNIEAGGTTRLEIDLKLDAVPRAPSDSP